jgi:hypothetical protein
MSKKKSAAAETVVETQATAPETQTSVEPATLTIADLQLLAQIVDLASTRGAFRAAELAQVGSAYTKLSTFLSHVAGVEKEKEKVAEEAAAN